MIKHWFRKKAIAPSNEDILRMRSVCEGISKALAHHGYQVPALSARTRAWPEDFAGRCSHLETYLGVLAAAAVRPKDMLWHYFSGQKLTPQSDLMDLLNDEDIFEIYDMDGHQIYRSLNYFSIVSMSVEDLVCMNWKRDFKRSSKITIDLLELVLRFSTGYFRQTFDCAKIPVHTVEEQFARRHRIELSLKYISPLKRDGKCQALLASSRAKVIGQAP
jgi:hypothetical protein